MKTRFDVDYITLIAYIVKCDAQLDGTSAKAIAIEKFTERLSIMQAPLP